MGQLRKIDCKKSNKMSNNGRKFTLVNSLPTQRMALGWMLLNLYLNLHNHWRLVRDCIDSKVGDMNHPL